MNKKCENCGKRFSVRLQDQKKKYCGTCEKKINQKAIEALETEDLKGSTPQRLKAIQEELTACDTLVNQTREDLQERKEGLAKLDRSQSSDIEKLLENLPADSPKKILDGIYKIQSPKRAQLNENIAKLEFALQSVGSKKKRLILERRQLEKDAKEGVMDAGAKETFQELDKWLKAYVEIEKSFLRFKALVAETASKDPAWHLRAESLDYSKAFDLIGDAFLKPESLKGLTMFNLVERVMNLKDTYGPSPIESDPELADLRLKGGQTIYKESFSDGHFPIER